MNKRPILLISLTGLLLATVWFAMDRVVRDRRVFPPAVSIPAAPVTVEASRWKMLEDPAVAQELRLEMACTIAAGIPDREIEDLFRIMERVPPGNDKEASWLVVNEIMEQMRKHGLGPERYSGVLVSIMKNRDQDPVLRDYAVQHLVQWLAPAHGALAPGETDARRRAAALDAIIGSIRDPANERTTIPGTAILALADVLLRLDPSDNTRVWSQLEPLLAEMLEKSGTASAHTKASSIHIATRFSKGSFLPAIRDYARSNGIDPAIRLSAIHALGVLGSGEDVPLLHSLAGTDNPFRPAAYSALSQLSPR